MLPYTRAGGVMCCHTHEQAGLSTRCVAIHTSRRGYPHVVLPYTRAGGVGVVYHRYKISVKQRFFCTLSRIFVTIAFTINQSSALGYAIEALIFIIFMVFDCHQGTVLMLSLTFLIQCQCHVVYCMCNHSVTLLDIHFEVRRSGRLHR